MCCAMSSIATRFSAPRGTTMSAWLFDGPMKVSNEGLTNCSYLVVVMVVVGWLVGAGRGNGRAGASARPHVLVRVKLGAWAWSGLEGAGRYIYIHIHMSALLQHAVEVSAALRHVASNAPGEPHVWVGVDEDLHVEPVAEALVVEREDAWCWG